jgi:hypothetical protein
MQFLLEANDLRITALPNVNNCELGFHPLQGHYPKFDKHPLFIQALAGEVKNHRRAPGNFVEWRKANPKFDPTKCPRVQDAMGHVLEYALRGLDDKARKVLETIAAFRMPTSYDTLAALFVDDGKGGSQTRPFKTELGLDVALKELEDHGLLGWDKRANRYDLHPIVRGVVWSGLPDNTRRGVYANLHTYFDSLPLIDKDEVSLEDLTPAVELCNTLIGLGRYEDALWVFQYRIDKIAFYRLSANRKRVELFEMFFPDGVSQLSRLSTWDSQTYMLNSLALAYKNNGQPRSAVPLYLRSIELDEKCSDIEGVTIGLCNLSNALRLSGGLYESEFNARHALVITVVSHEFRRTMMNC